MDVTNMVGAVLRILTSSVLQKTLASRAVGDSETKLACAIIRRSCNFSKEVKENV